MKMQPLTIPVTPEAARIYQEASEQEKLKMQALVSIWLKDFATRDPRSLEEIMDEMSRTAQANGLTPEILESILNEEK